MTEPQRGQATDSDEPLSVLADPSDPDVVHVQPSPVEISDGPSLLDKKDGFLQQANLVSIHNTFLSAHFWGVHLDANNNNAAKVLAALFRQDESNRDKEERELDLELSNVQPVPARADDGLSLLGPGFSKDGRQHVNTGRV